jgi:hypothetical protein
MLNPTTHIRDDFAGKTAGSLAANGNLAHSITNAALQIPTGTWNELSQADYDSIKTLDGTLKTVTTSVNGERAQLKLSFDIVRMVEDKIGIIPSLDKVAWVKANLSSYAIRVYECGSNPSGNKAYLKCWRADINSWVGTDNITNTAPSVVLVGANHGHFGEDSTKNIDSNGLIHFLIYTDASDGVTPSQVNLAYAYLDITLKTPAGYDVLAPENPRRDAGKSNILLVRKETKELQAFTDASNTDGIVTYGQYTDSTSYVQSANAEVTILAELGDVLLTDLGTSVGAKQGTHQWLNPTYRVKNDNDGLYGELGFGSVELAADSKGANTGAKVNIGDTGFKGKYTVQYAAATIQKPLLGIFRWLVLHNGELKLLVLSLYKTDGVFNSLLAGVCMLIPISGRPLTMEPEGVVRNGTIVSTAWRTTTGRVQGWQNDQGQIINTYI